MWNSAAMEAVRALEAGLRPANPFQPRGANKPERPLVVAIWAAEIGFLDKRVPTRPLAAEGRLTLNT